MAGESKLQRKVVAWLKDNGFWVTKVIVCTVSGTPDVLACSPKGRFVGVELKHGSNALSELQKYHIEEIKLRGGLAFAAWDLETVIFNLQGEIAELPEKQKQEGEFLL